jgi:hypothetical protein
MVPFLGTINFPAFVICGFQNWRFAYTKSVCSNIFANMIHVTNSHFLRFCSEDPASLCASLLKSQWLRQSNCDRFHIPLRIEPSNHPFSAKLHQSADGSVEFVSSLVLALIRLGLSDQRIRLIFDQIAAAREPNREISRKRTRKAPAAPVVVKLPWGWTAEIADPLCKMSSSQLSVKGLLHQIGVNIEQAPTSGTELFEPDQ